VCLSGILLLLGFVSAVRAVAVKESETLFLDSVLTEDGQFRKYDEGFRARGFLYCAAMNTATNDHIAQFVKGAHNLSAAAVFLLLAAAVPTSLVFLRAPSSPTETKIVGTVNFSSQELSALRDDVANLRNDIQRLSNTRASADGFKLLEEKVEQLDAKLSEMQRAKHSTANKAVTPQAKPTAKP
jgi:hypothetical protein